MTSYLSFFLVLCFIFLLPSLNEANQSDQLKKLIKSQKAFPSSSSQYLSSLSSSRSFSPVYIGRQKGMMEADKIQELPGQPAGVDFNQYAGHVTVDPKNGRAFFYYFVESPQNSSSKPLLLWLNGGPGCSSMGYGAMEEHGPFRVNSDGKTLTRNEYAWNNVANVIYLESPTGVGFSYSNTSSDYKDNGDKKTAADNYVFLVNWLERFPQYKTCDFYITGESYAGHYIPQLAYNIIQNNKVTNQTVINLRGVAIGNAFIDRESNVFGIYQFYWGHALISDDTYAKIQSSCNFANRIPSIKCDEAIGTAAEELGSIDGYNIYAPLCDGTNTQSDSGMPNFDPCSDDYVNTYLNSPAVQKALHATVTKTFEWYSCSDFPYIDMPDTVLPIIQELISSGLTLWLFSGDVDSVVPITSTRYSIKKLGLPVNTSWRPWYFNEEVGGYVEEYKGLTLATIRGAGHMVPSYQPQRALAMISSFLKGQLPPSGNK